MDVPLGDQCLQFLLALPVGVLIGLFYRVFRSFGRRGHAVLWDSVFVILALGGGTVFFLTICRGEPRAFHLLGLFLGAVLFDRAFRRRKKRT